MLRLLSTLLQVGILPRCSETKKANEESLHVCVFSRLAEETVHHYRILLTSPNKAVLVKQEANNQISDKGFIEETDPIVNIFTLAKGTEELVIVATAKNAEEFIYKCYTMDFDEESNKGLAIKADFKNIVSSRQLLPITISKRKDADPYLFIGMENKELTAWNSQGEKENNLSEILKGLDKKLILAENHTSTFIDIDGDSSPDIFLVCEETIDNELRSVGELFVNTSDGVYEYAKSKKIILPKNSGPVTFADFTGTRSFDLIVGYNEGSKALVKIYKNQQRVIKIGFIKETREEKRVTMWDKDEVFGFTEEHTEILNVGDILRKKDLKIEISTNFGGIDFPLFIYAIDAKRTGYPGLFVPVCNISKERIYVFIDRAEKNEENPKQTYVSLPDLKWIEEIKDPIGVSLYEFNGSKNLSLVVNYQKDKKFWHCVSKIETGESHGLKVTAYSYNPNKKTYIGSYFVATINYTVNVEMSSVSYRVISQGSQLMYFGGINQTQYIGLGRSQTLIESLKVGFSLYGNNYSHYGGMLPNSAVYLKTKKGSVDPVLIPEGNPAFAVPFYISLACSALCMLISGLLYLKEVREDKKERRDTVHVMNYDAL
eukprot:GHVP01059512.1.p1 GENE.GHVP01059512.1~~GHVP01059512.1.p1  ORF type:complete len:601 (-),score=108.29 GHVP01059512.1:473-2275(-)